MPEINRSSLTSSVEVTTSDAARRIQADDDFDFRWYVDALRARWLLVLAGAVLGAALGLAAGQLEPIRYEGAATVMVVPPAGPEAAVVPATYVALLRNAGLATEVVSELGLNKPPYDLTVRSFLDDCLQVDELRGTRLFRVIVLLPDPNLAADAARRMAEKAVTLNQQLTEQEGHAAQNQLKAYLDDAAERLKTAERDLLEFQQKAQVDLVSKDADALLDQRQELPRLLVALEGEKGRLRAAEEDLARYQRTRPAAGTPAAGETSAPADAVFESLSLEASRSRARLAELEQQRRQLIAVDKLGGDQLAKLSVLYSRQLELARLQNGYDIAKRVYSDLSLKYQESRTIAVNNSVLLQMVDRGIPADRPVSRRRAQSLALGLLAGTLITSLLALALAPREPGA